MSTVQEPFSFGFGVHRTTDSTKSGTPSPEKSNKKTRQSPQKSQQSPPQEEKEPEITSIDIDPSSVSKLLNPNHLNAHFALSFHDLQCGTGTLALQAYLEYTNLRSVMGMEQSKEYFHWAQGNAVALTKSGYKGRQFMLVENIPGVKTVIAEKASKEAENAKKFSKGDIVICFVSSKSKSIDKKESFRGIVRSVKKDGLVYDIEMSSNQKTLTNIKRELIFKPGKERALEFARGNCFQRKDGFRSDIILLPFYIGNDSYKQLLFQALKRASFKTRILAYEQLEEWESYPIYSFRRIDCNIYDNDRFKTSLSNYSKLYCYHHIVSNDLASPQREVDSKIKNGLCINVRDVDSQKWINSRIKSVNKQAGTIIVNRVGWEVPFEETVKLTDQRIHILDNRFKIGDIVHCYCASQIEKGADNQWNLYRCSVRKQNDNGTYEIEYEDGEVYRKQPFVWMFNPPKFPYREGEVLYARRYDRNDTVPNVETCVVRHYNPDGTYRIEFILSQTTEFHDHFCESWLEKPSDDESLRMMRVVPITLEIDYDRIKQWRPNLSAHFLRKCGIEEKYCKLFAENGINGPFLLDLSIDTLTADLNIPDRDANEIYAYVRALRRHVRYSHSDDKSISIQINENIRKYEQLLSELRGNENSLLSRLEDEKKTSVNDKALRDYELKVKCATMGKSGNSKKDVVKKLGKPMNWVNKYYKQNPNSFKKPNTSNPTFDKLKVEAQQASQKATAMKNKLEEEKVRLAKHNMPM